MLNRLNKLALQRSRLGLLLSALFFLAAVVIQRSIAAQLTTANGYYAPGDTVWITGTDFAPGESVTVAVEHIDSTAQNSEDHQPWDVQADIRGSFLTSWVVLYHDAGEIVRVTATGQFSGLVATNTTVLHNSNLTLVSVPDTVVAGETLTILANLVQSCGSGETAPLENRMVLFFATEADCEEDDDIDQVSPDSNRTDSLGNAIGQLVFSSVGSFGVGIKFRGEDTPSPCPDTGNSACDPLNPNPNLRCVHISSSSDCRSIVVIDTVIPIYIDADSPVDLVVTDPNSDSIGVSFNTISGATYSISNDSIFIPAAILGDYKIRVALDTLDQSGDTTYGLTGRIDGYAEVALAAAAPLPDEGESHNYVINHEDSLPQCLSMPGDANADGTLTLSDILAIAHYIFYKSGCSPIPDCWLLGLKCRGNWDGNQRVDIVDVIRGVNYVFDKPLGPWDPVPVGVCCQPLP